MLARKIVGRGRRLPDAPEGRGPHGRRPRSDTRRDRATSTKISKSRSGTAGSRCIRCRWWPSDHGGRNRLDHEPRPRRTGAARRQDGPAHVPFRPGRDLHGQGRHVQRGVLRAAARLRRVSRPPRSPPPVLSWRPTRRSPTTTTSWSSRSRPSSAAPTTLPCRRQGWWTVPSTCSTPGAPRWGRV